MKAMAQSDAAAKSPRVRLSPLHEALASDETVPPVFNLDAARRRVNGTDILTYFQPIVDFTNQHKVHLEVLMRVVSADGRIESPVEFVKTAERTGQINALTRRVIRKALTDLTDYAAADLSLSVNISPLSLLSSNLPAWLHQTTLLHGFRPENVTLEITEGMRIDGPLSAKYVAGIERLKALGFPIAIDDFGQGYSNLSKIVLLNPRYLKLDREFLINVPENNRANDVIEAVAYLCRKMGITLIAEGLETKAQLDHLLSIDCSAFQGYYFSRPLPAAELIKSHIFKNSLWEGYNTTLTMNQTINGEQV